MRFFFSIFLNYLQKALVKCNFSQSSKHLLQGDRMREDNKVCCVMPIYQESSLWLLICSCKPSLPTHVEQGAGSGLSLQVTVKAKWVNGSWLIHIFDCRCTQMHFIELRALIWLSWSLSDKTAKHTDIVHINGCFSLLMYMSKENTRIPVTPSNQADY